MKRVCRCIVNQKGSTAAEVIIWAAIVLLVIMPAAAVVLEKYIMLVKAQEIKNSIDITNTAVYNSLDVQSIGEAIIDFNNSEAIQIYRNILAKNLKLDENLEPTEGSIASAGVIIQELILYTNNFPTVCSRGKSITRPTIHSVIMVPVKPSLYRAFVLSRTGQQDILLTVHVDTELPVNN